MERIQIDRVKLISQMAKQHITCAELAKSSGVGTASITYIRGGKIIKATTAEKLAAALGVPLSELVADEA